MWLVLPSSSDLVCFTTLRAFIVHLRGVFQIPRWLSAQCSMAVVFREVFCQSTPSFILSHSLAL